VINFVVAATKFDYKKVQTRAIARVAKFGREITLVKLSGDAPDSAKPWRGPTNVRSETPLESVTTSAVFVEPESLERLGLQRQAGDFVKSGEMVAIVASTQDLSNMDEVIDGEIVWKIFNVQVLTPGDIDIPVIQYLRVQRRGKVTPTRGALL
jgi:hypothetical protein